MLVTGVGQATAADAAGAVGGRDRIKVAIQADSDGATCQVLIGGSIVTTINVPPNQQWFQVYSAEPGTQQVAVTCGGVFIFNTQVNVDKPNAFLDAIDNSLEGIGSSQLSTDRTRR
ncbi:hypothetical protein FOS14_21985 [Skermania sp. ID1734]|uniref:hypothetical protein n=1 Tax=Skermania sp. ID1734 TaxID=2597516 RepID=UPI0011811129|nr:hypothetical protein [Skermania sp. ID1734]TSD93948.1 hypothetical protein FOS14_21985 [Skermania sp. ID1734]